MKERIKEIRIYYNLTQEEFSKKIGLARNSIANYEIGRREPTNAVISLICKVFSINEDWLRFGSGTMIALDKENQLMSWAGSVLKETDESFKKRFINMLMMLNEKDWESLEKMALFLYEKKASVLTR